MANSFAFRRAPLKALHLLLTVMTLLVKLPGWTVLLAFPSARQKASWSFKRALLVSIFQHISPALNKWVLIHPIFSSRVEDSRTSPESGRSRFPLTSNPSPNPKSRQASGANPSQSSSPGASSNGPRPSKSRPFACQGIGTTPLGLILLWELVPSRTRKSYTTSTLGLISWRLLIRRGLRP